MDAQAHHKLETDDHLLVCAVFGVLLMFSASLACASIGDIYARGTIYNAATYSTHPSYFGHADKLNVVDINVGSGAYDCNFPLYAPESGGTVTRKYSNHSGWGNAIIWEKGSESLFLAHLNAFGKDGSVNSGDVIGYVGNTGVGEYCHLHIESNQGRLVLSGRQVVPEYWYNGPPYTSTGPVETPPSAVGFVDVSLGIAVSANPVVIGETFDVSFSLREHRNGPKTFEQVGLAILDGGGRHLFDAKIWSNVNFLPGQTREFSASTYLVDSRVAGTYQAIARGRIDGAWFDFETVDNGRNPVRFEAVEATADRADFVVSSISVIPSEDLRPGAQFGGTMVIKNSGKGNPDSKIRSSYEIKGPGTNQAWMRIGDDGTDASDLESGESASEGMGKLVPAPLEPGEYILRGCADYRNDVEESNEQNNCKDTRFTISPPNRVPEGGIDSGSCSTISGWARDPDTASPIALHVYLLRRGETGAGQYIGFTVANGAHDVFASHGFHFQVPAELRNGTAYKLIFYALDDKGGHNPEIGFWQLLCGPVGADLYPAYRMYHPGMTSHLYTISESEKNRIAQSEWLFEGIEWFAHNQSVRDSVPLHRFYLPDTGHFLTASEEERSKLIADPAWAYEGEVFYAYPYQRPGTLPVHRFYSSTYTDHFFTVAKDVIVSSESCQSRKALAGQPTHCYEGVGWYAYASPPSAPSCIAQTVKSVDPNAAEVVVEVNPRGTITRVWAEYGKTEAFGRIIDIGEIGSGKAPIARGVVMSALDCGTRYFMQARCVNDGGAAASDPMTFETAECPLRDEDGDGVSDDADNCVGEPNVDQADLDGDRRGDVCDDDDDDDGVGDDLDAFPRDPNESEDSDADGHGNNADNCPRHFNSDQADLDRDGRGDVCDLPVCWECLPSRGGWRSALPMR